MVLFLVELVLGDLYYMNLVRFRVLPLGHVAQSGSSVRRTHVTVRSASDALPPVEPEQPPDVAGLSRRQTALEAR
uniref:Uncharacterized protein n=1 Tax=Oryza brachyantha TaxID=4533 RepID=J3KY46_ORYBR